MAGKNSSNFVVDASCLIKWVGLEVDNFAEAEKLRLDFVSGKINILILALTLWELGNYLGRNLDPAKATSTVSHFQSYKLCQTLLPLKTASLSFQIMQKHPSVSFYDASYHALAISENATFLTCDKKYYEKTKRLGHIKLLKDY